MYSNGFHTDNVLSALFGRLGWSDTSLNAANQESRSGRKFDDSSFHNLVTVQNLKDTTEASDWDTFFENKQNAVILKCLNSLFSCNYSDNTILYRRDSEIVEEISNSGKFVGMKFIIAPRLDTVVQLNSVQLYFNDDVTFNLYLFKDGKVAPISTIEVDAVGNEYTEVSLTDIYLKYPGQYYLGYFQDDIGVVKAIRENTCFNKTYNFAAIPFCSNKNLADFDRINLSYMADSYGLNLNVSSFKDYTSAITSRPQLFDELLGQAMALNCLEQMVTSLTSNDTERKLKEHLVTMEYDLNGTIPVAGTAKKQSLKDAYAETLEKVRKSFYPPESGVYSLC